MNKTVIIGNLGQDAQVRQTQDGKSFLSFSVAVSDGYGENKKTLWFSCSGWGDRFVSGRLPEFLKAGTKVYIEGKYAPSLFTRQDGSTDISHNLMVNQIELLSAATQSSVAQPAPASQPAQAPTYSQPTYAYESAQAPATNAGMNADDEDLPF